MSSDYNLLRESNVSSHLIYSLKMTIRKYSPEADLLLNNICLLFKTVSDQTILIHK